MNTGRDSARFEALWHPPGLGPSIRQPEKVYWQGYLESWLMYEPTPEEEAMRNAFHRDLTRIQQTRTLRYPRWNPIRFLKQDYTGFLMSPVDGTVFRTAEEVWAWAEEVAEGAEQRATEWGLQERDRMAHIPKRVWGDKLFTRHGGNWGPGGGQQRFMPRG